MSEHTIYGDGFILVTVADDKVTIRKGVGEFVEARIRMSRAAFREVVVGWERLLAMEEEDE